MTDERSPGLDFDRLEFCGFSFQISITSFAVNVKSFSCFRLILPQSPAKKCNVVSTVSIYPLITVSITC